MRQLKHVLLSWKLWDNPQKLVYVTDHIYSANDLRNVSLQGKDAHVVSHLRGIAEGVGFSLCLVNLELHRSGQADDDGQYDSDPYAEYDSDDEVERRLQEQGRTIVEVEDETWSFEDAVDLDGNSAELNEDLDLTDESEFLPHSLAEMSPNDREYEGYMGNVRTVVADS